MELLENVKKDVWLPFMQSYKDLDAEKLQAIHDKDIMRISVDSNKIYGGQIYLQELHGFFAMLRQKKEKAEIIFSIGSTAFNANYVYQTGFYRFKATNTDGLVLMTNYREFMVVLQKQDGVWKITQDMDRRSNLDEESFRKSGTIYELKP
ncbi:nuclear transport factor 2 family protein [Muricauda sp. 2012CJ35-5]|uniref:Nuclear transport factor 2 family protein n=1 Tax=Flagellimonas spongiicola TaxID=2942208 RepID=A0ABT0PN10_9FLAO|nr:nuclear transport factor 2 family protein [Allomuricauda spongiicola]MCL6272626.1 nuclear transport factor 2 family protein [Allomuricauda spongiicola]